jgi:sigma-B regulation protein RsbU (phosphoserine phosphatase)
MIRVLLADDEEPARDRLRTMLARFDDLQVVGEAVDGDDAIDKIARLRPDLIFLDIRMPGRTGMEVAASIEPPRPRVVFCTAFDQYAIDAFEHHAVDYLLKPPNATRLTRAVERVRTTIAEERRLRRELAAASDTQARLLPQSLPPMHALDYSGVCRPARDVGGDYYDFLLVGPHQLAIAVGDVSGKGLYAALLVANLQARIQSIAPLHVHALEELMTELDRLMYASTHDNKYATLFYSVFDDERRTLTYANAGHTPPLLLRREGTDHRVERLESTGPVIGLIEGAQFQTASLQLDAGDVLLIHTDGVTEATNPAGEEFGEGRLTTLVPRIAHLSAAALRDAILDEISRFVGASPPHDDLTLVVARVV